MMKRLFFALWPDDGVRRQIVQICRRLPDKDMKPVRSSNLHVTLSFLGQVDADSERLLRQLCTSIQAQAVSLTFDRLSFWRKPRILCLIAEPPPPVLALVDAINVRAEEAGIRTESRLYRPHVTLARKVRKTVQLDFEPVYWRAQDFCLVESISLEDGVHYQVVQRWPLSLGGCQI